MAQLRVTSAALDGQTFNLEGEYYTIGREADNTIRLAHQSISKHHAMLTVDKGDFKLWDLHSTNGIVVNGQKAILRHLKDGDRIVLGDVEFLFSTNGLTSPAKAAAPQTETQRIVLPQLAPKLAPAIPKEPAATAKPAAPVELPLKKVPEPKAAMPAVTPARPQPPSEPKPAAIPAPQAATPVVTTPPPTPSPSEPKAITSTEHQAPKVVEPALTPAPIPKVETPVVALPSVSLPQPPKLLPIVKLKSAPPPNVPASKAETKELIIPPFTPAPSLPEPLKANSILPEATSLRSPRLAVMEAPLNQMSLPRVNLPFAPETRKATVPFTPITETKPAPVATAIKSTPAQRSAQGSLMARRLVYLAMFVGGVVLLVTGYGFNITGCKFIGFILTITGLICLTFMMRFKGIIAPPR